MNGSLQLPLLSPALRLSTSPSPFITGNALNLIGITSAWGSRAASPSPGFEGVCRFRAGRREMEIKLGSDFKLLCWTPNGAAANLDKTWGIRVKMPKASSEIRGREEPRPRPANLATRGATDTLLLLLLLLLCRSLRDTFFFFSKRCHFLLFSHPTPGESSPPVQRRKQRAVRTVK